MRASSKGDEAEAGVFECESGPAGDRGDDAALYRDDAKGARKELGPMRPISTHSSVSTSRAGWAVPIIAGAMTMRLVCVVCFVGSNERAH